MIVQMQAMNVMNSNSKHSQAHAQRSIVQITMLENIPGPQN